MPVSCGELLKARPTPFFSGPIFFALRIASPAQRLVPLQYRGGCQAEHAACALFPALLKDEEKGSSLSSEKHVQKAQKLMNDTVKPLIHKALRSPEFFAQPGAETCIKVQKGAVFFLGPCFFALRSLASSLASLSSSCKNRLSAALLCASQALRFASLASALL